MPRKSIHPLQHPGIHMQVIHIVRDRGYPAIHEMVKAMLSVKDSLNGKGPFAAQQRHKVILAPFSDFMSIPSGSLRFGDAGGLSFRTLRPRDMQEV